MSKQTYLFVGPPGSGKGTQAEKLSESLKLPHVDVGQLLRNRAAEPDEIGRQINSIMMSGKTVPEDLVLNELLSHLKTIDISKGLILDGYCRTTAQAHQLIKLDEQGVIPPLVVVSIEVPDELLLNRISHREYCVMPNGNRILLDSEFTKSDCQKQGGELLKRDDDNRKTFEERLRVYHEQTQPAVKILGHKDNLIIIDGRPSIEDVAQTLLTKVNNL